MSLGYWSNGFWGEGYWAGGYWASASSSNSNIKLSQIFNVYGEFVPTKTSIFLRPKITTPSTSFDISEVSIDSLNFASITQNANKLIPEYTIFGFTGKGYLSVEEFNASRSYTVVNYPIKASSTGSHDIWFRTIATGGSLYIEVRIDGVLIDIINDVAASTVDWEWNSVSYNFTDFAEHTLSVTMKMANNALDKIYINNSSIVPAGSGPSFSDSPYITTHIQLYTVDGFDRPDSPLFIYDYKTTLDEIRTDDWYNFDLNFLDDSRAVSAQDKYALVVYASGSSAVEYIVWEISDADSYTDGPSAIKS